jgi:hypothetical protein
MGVLNLKNAVVAAGFGLMTSGCTTMAIPTGGECIEGKAVMAPLGLGGVSSQRYNSVCGQNVAANSMLKTNDAGIRAVGMLTLEANSAVVKNSGDRVRDALANQGQDTYTATRDAQGNIIFRGTPIITVPQTQSTPAPAPKP